MAKALGIGGIFFKASDPKALMAWYQKWLGFPAESADYAAFAASGMPKDGMTVFTPFKQDTGYFAPSAHSFMFNLVVDDLDQALKQVLEGGAEQVGDIMDESYGRFGWFMDPQGNKVELWQAATEKAE